jgi:hypothetical protein
MGRIIVCFLPFRVLVSRESYNIAGTLKRKSSNSKYNWNRLVELNRITSRDKKFLRFVLFHIDELMSIDAVPTIRNNAVAHCPPIAKGLCKSILARLDK